MRLPAPDDKTTRVSLHRTGWCEGGANLKKRFEQGPTDWKPWLEQLERARAAPAVAASAPG